MAAPRKLTGNARKHAISLIKKYGPSGASRVLGADADSPLVALRAKSVPQISITSVALGNLAREAGIALVRGRRQNKLRPEAVVAA